MEEEKRMNHVAKLSDEAMRLNNNLWALATTNARVYPDNYENLLIDTTLIAETIACSLRHLTLDLGTVKRTLLLKKVSDSQGITVDEDSGIFKIVFPSLLPKRKRRKSNEFLLDPLYYALDVYCKEHRPERFQRCVICFSHVYDRSYPLKRTRDYDNLEIKSVLDVIGSFLLTDDSGALCDIYHTTEVADTDCTKVSIMSPDQFPVWLERQKGLKSISNFS